MKNLKTFEQLNENIGSVLSLMRDLKAWGYGNLIWRGRKVGDLEGGAIVMAFNDLMAAGAIEYVHRTGRHIPGKNAAKYKNKDIKVEVPK